MSVTGSETGVRLLCCREDEAATVFTGTVDLLNLTGQRHAPLR